MIRLDDSHVSVFLRAVITAAVKDVSADEIDHTAVHVQLVMFATSSSLENFKLRTKRLPRAELLGVVRAVLDDCFAVSPTSPDVDNLGRILTAIKEIPAGEVPAFLDMPAGFALVSCKP